jgi:hypothetical protein
MPLTPTPQEKEDGGQNAPYCGGVRSVRDEGAERRENNINNKPNQNLSEAVIHIAGTANSSVAID